MSNPSKQKGTGGETELLRLLEAETGRKFRRTAASSRWDLETADGESVPAGPINILATRPDKGQWLLSMTLFDWTLDFTRAEIRVEVKRYVRFSLHTIYEMKFGGKR